jgi:ABC-2 type transport system ATP-binding protein
MTGSPISGGAATSAVMIKAESLRKVYGQTAALSELSFEVAEGEVFGFIGANGAGKTTTLRILAGLTTPSGGWAEVDGADVVADRARLHELVGYMPDFFGVYDSMTATEYLAFYASCYRLPKHLISRVVSDLLELVQLSPKRDEQVDTLSRGMKQRLCLARALVHDPKVLLLDEPASGLDPRARAEMRELVQALREMGKTIVLSSHILPELAEMCSSYGIIHDGRMVAHGPASAILDNLGPRRARARVRGDLDEAERLAGNIAGIANVRRAGVDTLEIELGPDAVEATAGDPATLLGALVAAGIPVTEFREDDGGLEQLFLQLTAPAGDQPANEPVEQAR